MALEFVFKVLHFLPNISKIKVITTPFIEPLCILFALTGFKSVFLDRLYIFARQQNHDICISLNAK